MSEYLIYIVGFAALVVPMKIAANLLKTNRSGWLYCLLAVVLANVVNNAVSMFVPIVGFMYYGSILIAFLGMSAVVSITLGAKYHIGGAIVLLDIVIFAVIFYLVSIVFPGIVNVSINT